MKYLLLLAVILAGCAAPPKPVNSKDPTADHAADYDKCNYEAMMATPNSGTFAGTAREITLIRTCMKIKGWQ